MTFVLFTNRLNPKLRRRNGIHGPWNRGSSLPQTFPGVSRVAGAVLGSRNPGRQTGPSLLLDQHGGVGGGLVGSSLLR